MNKSIQIKVLSVNTSLKKGIIKTPVDFIDLTLNGIEGDAHAGDWHRQISMLASESIKTHEELAERSIAYGEFAENITTEGMLLYKSKPGDRFVNDKVEIEITQIGKKCHGDNCAIFNEIGNCVMPKQGIFCKVVKEGDIKAGDVLNYYQITK